MSGAGKAALRQSHRKEAVHGRPRISDCLGHADTALRQRMHRELAASRQRHRLLDDGRVQLPGLAQHQGRDDTGRSDVVQAHALQRQKMGQAHLRLIADHDCLDKTGAAALGAFNAGQRQRDVF